MIIRNQTAKGGTELQFSYLEKYVDKKLLDQVQICTSVPGKVPIDPNKLNILWQKNSWDQANLYPWFKDKNNHKYYNHNFKWIEIFSFEYASRLFLCFVKMFESHVDCKNKTYMSNVKSSPTKSKSCI